MAKKPRKVYSAALGRMVDVNSSEAVSASPRRPLTQRTTIGERVYQDGSDLDRLNITQRIIEHPESRVRRMEQADATRYDELLHSIYDGVLITDSDGNIEEVNTRSEFMFKWDHRDMLGLNIVDLISGADMEIMKVIRKNVSNRKFTILEAVCIRGDDTRFDAEIVVNRFKGNDGGGLCFFVRDVTMRKQAEEELKNANDMLIEAEKVQARMDTISTLLHGLNNPLQIMTCMAELEEHKEFKVQLDRVMVVLEQLRREDSLVEVVGGNGQALYDVSQTREIVPAEMGRILIADDETTIRDIFVSALKSAFPDRIIDQVGDGKTAVELFALRHHGVVIMDVSMPVMNGEMAFYEIEQVCDKEGWQMPNIIFCTGFLVNDNIKEIVKDGSVHMYVSKPLSLTALVDSVRSRVAR